MKITIVKGGNLKSPTEGCPFLVDDLLATRK